MRPERLVVEGFSTFRERTEVDFRGADLFALTGATGAGKSSIIDAIVFALYGSIPRLDDRRLVAPVISQDKVEARVQLDFSIDDVRYRAVRVVREVPGKGRAGAAGRQATTKEARLERLGDEQPDGTEPNATGDGHGDGDGAAPPVAAGEVLAGNPDELTDTVTRLLGLSFEHFTTCVVLPQGQFARFLHHKPRDRQELLIELLDLGVYGRMASAARSRAAAASQQVEWLGKERERYGFASPVAVKAASDRVTAIEALRSTLDAAQPRIDELALAARDRRAQATDATEVIERLLAVEVPADVDGLASVVTRSADALEQARTAVTVAVDALGRADRVVEELPDTATLELAKRDHVRAAELRTRVDRGETVTTDAEANRDDAAAKAEKAKLALTAKVADLEAARIANRAADLARHLVVGDPCPVCGNEVHDVVEHEATDLRAAEQAEHRARKSADAMDRALSDATANLTRMEDLLTDLRGQLVDAESAVADAPPVDAIDEQLGAIEEATTARRQLRADEQAARKALERAERAVADAEATAGRGWTVFDVARDRLAVLEPPAPERSDLAAAWRALDDWTSAQATRFTDELAVIEKEVLELTGRHDDEVAGVLRACAAAEVDVPRGRLPRDAAIEALADAKADLVSIEDAVARLAELDAEVGALTTTADVAAALGRHLGAKGFEKWVLDEALDRLIAGASSVLHELSDGAYSLVLDAASSTFFVKDHFNADALRSARTLSGGETFLASLALALALADQVAELAAGGAVRLESIFLDEGFGTLDPDTLDTVATAIEELGAQGRMVGVVSHVVALAERMPVRFVVTKGPTTSTVVREDA